MTNSLDKMDGSATAILVTFNSEKVIADSLRSLQRSTAIRQIIVVDNASADSTVSMISTDFPNVRLIANLENIGFGPANNLGLEQVTTEFALVLNPDTVVSNRAVSTLLQVAADHKNAAIVGPRLQSPDKPKSKVRIGSVWDPQKAVIPTNTDLRVDFLSGAAMLMRMSLIRNSGYFNPDIFLFYEDDDICHSARRAGYDLILTSKATLTHMVGKSTVPNLEILAFKQCHFTWSRLYLEEKEFGKAAALKLARKTRHKILRKQFFARLMRDQKQPQILKACTYAVECFLQGEAPTKVPAGFFEQIAEASDDSARVLKLAQTEENQGRLSRPA